MFKFQPDNGNPLYGTVVNETAVVFGTEKKVVSTALAAAASGKKPAVSKDLAALITKMDDKASVWVAAVVKDKLNNVRLPGGGGQNLQSQFPNMDTVSLVIRVTTDINFELGLGMKDDKSAREMGDAVDETLKLIKGLAPLAAAQDPRAKPLVEVAKTLKSDVKDRTVVITAKMTGDAIGQMLKPGD